MTEWYPGKVLVIDEEFDQVSDFISELIKKNVPVQYWDSTSPLTSSVNNIRIVLIDLDLTGSGLPRTNLFDYYPAAEALSKIDGPHLILILSTNWIPEDTDNLKQAYQDRFTKPLIGFVNTITGITKKTPPDELYKIIQNIISTEKVFEIILTWEKILDLAKDEALKKFAGKGFENELFRFIKSLNTDFGKNSLGREFVGNMMKFVLRYMNRGHDFETLSEILKTLDLSTVLSSSDLLLSNLQMYHIPDASEPTWTGDIYELETCDASDKKFQKYGIVLTPPCDFPQRDTDRILLCEGFLLDYDSLTDKEHPLYKFFPSFQLAKRDAANLPQYDVELQKTLRSIKTITPRLYRLWNFTKDKENFSGLFFDFQNIKSIPEDELKKHARICRLDSPFVEDLLQKYGSHSTRLGLPTTNSPHLDGKKLILDDRNPDS